MLRVYTKRVNYVGNRGRHESASIFKETVDTWNEFPSVRRRRQWPVTAAVVISPENRIGQTPCARTILPTLFIVLVYSFRAI